ncbi:hypothetical protein ACJZ2D_012459 [Fusarium nematophilum]
MSLDKVSASLMSAINENTLALATAKLDVSMIKVEVPSEYTGLSAGLTSHRRAAAEDGSVHQTARRLGILFQDVLPSTPELLRAYGKRSAEISRASTKPSEQNIVNGIFANFLGADITSVWAAATSGASSIAVHLLACLLARLWSAPEATSIWVEIVAERKRRIENEVREGVYKTSLELHLVYPQEISRDDLAQWDSGARAWLQVADDVQLRQQKQLMLIINNIHLPVNTGGSTYDRRVANGATLMGVSSWHLYPDLLVLGERISPIHFKDELIPNMGQLTIGIESTGPEQRHGIFWSLPLSHLRFYGDPVLATTHTTRDASRVSMEELQFLAFGSAISSWGDHYLDAQEVAKFFRALELKGGPFDAPDFRWLLPLCRVSEALLSATDEDFQNARSMIALGRLNGRQFLSDNGFHPPPYLGIGHPFTSQLLKKPPDAVDSQDLERLRFIAETLGLPPNDSIIRVVSQNRAPEYPSAVPHRKCIFDGMAPRHIRWIPSNVSRESWANGNLWVPRLGCFCHAQKHSCHPALCPCIREGVSCSPRCHGPSDPPTEPFEKCSICENKPLPTDITRGAWGPLNRPSPDLRASGTDGGTLPAFALLAGDPNGMALFIRIDRGFVENRRRVREVISQLSSPNSVDPKNVITTLESKEIVKATLRRFLLHITTHGRVEIPRFRKDLCDDIFHIDPFVQSLKALHVASATYENLGGTTISLRIIERPLYRVNWVPDGGFFQRMNWDLSRTQRFACIAFFESGAFDMSPASLSDVIAISTRNSLFISAILLSEPFDESTRNDIRHVIGNVGKAGTVMMAAPLKPRIRPVDINKWKQISHAPFLGETLDCFGPTSLHLSFTEFEMPVDIGQRGSIDRDTQVRVVETVISVYDRGEWVADLDVLALYEPALAGYEYVRRLGEAAHCKKSPQQHQEGKRLTSIDNWEELINLPADIGIHHVGVVRARDNWLARVATACVSAQKGFRTVILPSSNICWSCCSARTWQWDLPRKDGMDDSDLGHQGIKREMPGYYPMTKNRPFPHDDTVGSEGDDENEDVISLSYESDSSNSSAATVTVGGSFRALPQVLIC